MNTPNTEFPYQNPEYKALNEAAEKRKASQKLKATIAGVALTGAAAFGLITGVGGEDAPKDSSPVTSEAPNPLEAPQDVVVTPDGSTVEIVDEKYRDAGGVSSDAVIRGETGEPQLTDPQDVDSQFGNE